MRHKLLPRSHALPRQQCPILQHDRSIEQRAFFRIVLTWNVFDIEDRLTLKSLSVAAVSAKVDLLILVAKCDQFIIKADRHVFKGIDVSVLGWRVDLLDVTLVLGVAGDDEAVSVPVGEYLVRELLDDLGLGQLLHQLPVEIW